jgi:hypothetical protein
MNTLSRTAVIDPAPPVGTCSSTVSHGEYDVCTSANETGDDLIEGMPGIGTVILRVTDGTILRLVIHTPTIHDHHRPWHLKNLYEELSVDPDSIREKADPPGPRNGFQKRVIPDHRVRGGDKSVERYHGSVVRWGHSRRRKSGQIQAPSDIDPASINSCIHNSDSHPLAFMPGYMKRRDTDLILHIIHIANSAAWTNDRNRKGTNLRIRIDSLHVFATKCLGSLLTIKVSNDHVVSTQWSREFRSRASYSPSRGHDGHRCDRLIDEPHARRLAPPQLWGSSGEAPSLKRVHQPFVRAHHHDLSHS